MAGSMLGTLELPETAPSVGCIQVNNKMFTQYLCHMTGRVKSHVSSLGSDMVIIPGGLTSQVQPADVSWNKPFKSAYRELYNEWMAYGKKSYTPAGNMRQPEKKLSLEWVKQAWAQVSTEVVMKSCSISSNTDGSEDNMIHCLKPGELAVDVVAKETAKINSNAAIDLDEDSDPFSDISSEEDETQIEDC